MKNISTKKNILLILLSIVLVFSVLTATSYALFFRENISESQSTYTTGVLDISFEEGETLNLDGQLPMNNDTGVELDPYVVTITNTGTLAYNFDIKLLSTTVSNAISSQYIKVSVSKNRVASQGVGIKLLNNFTDGIIYNNLTLDPTESITLYIRIWLTSNTPSTEIGKSFSAVITTDGQAVYTDINEPNKPKLNEGMIPVVYDENTGNWVKAAVYFNGDTDMNHIINGFDLGVIIESLGQWSDTVQFHIMDSDNNKIIDNYDEDFVLLYAGGSPSRSGLYYMDTSSEYNWYDYDSGKWANMVLVSSTNRRDYSGSEPGTVIAESDILAQYVWIPRYKYRVWNKDKVIGVSSYNAYEKGIDIQWEKGTSTTGTISYNYDFAIDPTTGPNEVCTGSNYDEINGEFYTHPAFTFGDEELTGFWMAKYETSSDTPTNYSEFGAGTTVRVLPNVNSWRQISIFEAFTLAQNMQNSSNIYGLTTDTSTTDSHLIRNKDWGAVAYLSHSKYGLCSDGSCTEIGINNVWNNADGGNDYDYYYTTKTGCGSVAGSNYSTVCSAYNTDNGMKASTTGTVYGIYDMSGGAGEMVMGNTSASQTDYVFPSVGFSNNFPLKYVDTYKYGISNYNQITYNRARLGDATGEVVLTGDSNGAWYGDKSFFFKSTSSWLTRGNLLNNSSSSGIFSFENLGGDFEVSTGEEVYAPYRFYGFRLALS